MNRPKNMRHNLIYILTLLLHENSGIAIGQEKGIVPEKMYRNIL